MKYMNQVERNITNIEEWVNINLTNYLKKNQEDVGEIEHILDFLQSKDCPRRIRYMSYSEAKAGSQKWLNKMIKQARNIVETEEDTEVIHDFEDGMTLVKLIGKSAFQREGKLMSHCVSAYFGKSDMNIYSLRDINNNPHCTFELIEGNMNQIKGKGNGSIHPNYIAYVIKCLEKFGVKVRDSEMVNLGYSPIYIAELWSFLNINFTGIKTVTLSGNKYFYNNSVLHRKVETNG